MLRSHRVSSEKLWSHVGVRMGKDSSGLVKRSPTCCPLAGQPNKNRHHHNWSKHLHYRSFSSGTTGLIKEQSTPSTSSSGKTPAQGPPPKDGNVLVSAAKEAQRLSDLAAKSRPEKTVNPTAAEAAPKTWREPSTLTWESVHKREVDEETIQSALESAQALLFVTRLDMSSPLRDAIRDRHEASPEIQKQISSLHRAFLAVTSWCLDVVTMAQKPDPRMLDMGLQVARRAHQLQLPFHMPLYIRLMNAVAEHHDPKNSSSSSSNRNNNKNIRNATGALILELAGRATVMLGPAAIESSQLFFREPLEALVNRRCFGDVAAVLRGIESQYSSLELDKGTLLKLLVALEIAVSEDNNNNDDDETEAKHWEDTADVLEILNLADPYLWKTITSLTSLSDIWNRNQDKKREKREELQRSMRRSEPQPTIVHEKLLPSTPSRESVEARRAAPVRRKRSTESYAKKDDLYYFRGWIYQSESPSEHEVLPDITAQIEALYDGKDFRYSEDLERQILKTNMLEYDEDEAGISHMHDDLDMFGDELFSDDEEDFFDLISDDSDDDDDDGDDDDEENGS